MKSTNHSCKTWLIVFSALILSFQACGGQYDFGTDSRTEAPRPWADLRNEAGNGGGYDGKPQGTYFAYDPAQPCSVLEAPPRGSVLEAPPRGSELEAPFQPRPNKIIEVQNGRPYKIQNDCRPQAPVALGYSEFKLSEHQVTTFAFENMQFERVTSAPLNRYLEQVCRGVVATQSGAKTYLFDVLIRSNEAWLPAPANPPANLVADRQAEVLYAAGPVGAPSYALQSSGEFAINRQSGAGLQRYNSSALSLEINEASSLGSVQSVLNGEAVTGSLDCGLQKSEPNLLSYSQSFLIGPWNSPETRTDVNVVAANALAPDMTLSAYAIADTSSAASQRLLYHYLDVAPQDQSVRTFSAYLRKGTATESEVRLQYRAGSTEINNGTISVAWSEDGTATLSNLGSQAIGGDLTAVGNGWYRVWVTVQNNGLGNTMMRVMIDPARALPTGSTVGSVYVWGLQLEVGATPSPYQPTVLRY